MKQSLLLIIALLGAVVLAGAQDRSGTSSRYDKSFFQHEMNRYRSLFQQHPAEVASGQNIDATYYGLALRITTSPQYLRGDVTMKALSRQDGVNQITLDLMQSMTIDSVKVGGVTAGFSQHSSTFDVTLDRSYNTGELMTVEIFYEGIPGSSGFGSFEFSSHSSTPWVWSLSEPYGAKDWWPCKDHPSDKADSTDMRVTCDTAFKVGSNGRLVSITENGDGTHTYHWHEGHPISTYLVSLAITNYADFSNWFKYTPTDSMQVLNYVLPEHLSDAQTNLPLVVGELQIYSNLFGLYPFINEKYGHSEFGWGGGMEHQTMTSLGGFGEGLTAHELAHQWFGDMITCRTWPDIWLNEGFATFCELVYEEHKYGEGNYWGGINSDMVSAQQATASLYVSDSSSVGTLFDWNRVYAKGAVVLHMLRHVLGDSTFFHSMYNYANNPALRFSTAGTADFQAACESTSGKGLSYFFNEWVYGQKYPSYSYAWSAQPHSGPNNIKITLGQSTGTLNPSYFSMPIDFKVVGASWDTTVTVFNDSLIQTFSFDVSHAPVSVQLDPRGWILKQVSIAFSVSTPAINFGIIKVGLSKTDSVIVTNQGLTSISISSAISNDSDFSVTPTSASIAVSASRTFYVTFHPTRMGPEGGQIIFTHNGSNSPYQIDVNGTGGPVPYILSRNWNIVSVPSAVADLHKDVIFPTAISNAYRYSKDSGYVASDTLRNGVGYWLKFSDDTTMAIPGEPRYSDSIAVNAGWNLMGSISDPVLSSSVVALGTSLRSQFFGYSHGYRISDTIQPGKGYWIKVDAQGRLVLNSPGQVPEHTPKMHNTELPHNQITIRDDAGNEQVLYFDSESSPGSDIGRYEMPPVAPPGIFDARYASNRMIEFIKKGRSQEFPILISSAAYPLTISWELQPLIDAALEIGTREVRMSRVGVTQISNPKSQISLKLTGQSAVPTMFALEQNYPNPFNPATSFGFRIADRGFVSLQVYDLLGREVVTLVNEVKQPGEYSVKWDATSAPTGLYFARLTVTNVEGRLLYRAARKLLLVK
jgi:hypothetical protein